MIRKYLDSLVFTDNLFLQLLLIIVSCAFFGLVVYILRLLDKKYENSKNNWIVLSFGSIFILLFIFLFLLPEIIHLFDTNSGGVVELLTLTHIFIFQLIIVGINFYILAYLKDDIFFKIDVLYKKSKSEYKKISNVILKGLTIITFTTFAFTFLIQIYILLLETKFGRVIWSFLWRDTGVHDL